MDVIRNIEAPYLREGIPDFGPGDTIRIKVRVVEGDKVRQQAFQGVVIARSKTGTGETFTLRKVTEGVGIERIFPLHSPNIQEIEIVRRGRIRRAKLTYLRGRKGKSARIKEQTLRRQTKNAPANSPEKEASGEE